MTRSNFRNKISDRLAVYESRTGDNIMGNVISKVATGAGGLICTHELLRGASDTRNFLLGAAFMIGGAVGDRLTGGLRGYSDEAITLERSDNN